MIKPTEATKGLDINFKLSDQDRSLLLAWVKQDVFNLLQRLMEEEIRRLNVRLINTDAADTKAIIANHQIAKAAGMFYAGFIQRLIDELDIKAYADSGVGTISNPEQLELPQEFV